MRLEFDGVRLSDLSVVGWFALGFVAVGLGGAGYELVKTTLVGGNPLGAVAIGGIIALAGGMMAYENAAPEFEGTCDTCGRYIRMHSSRDTCDEVVRVQASGAPRRAQVGPVSINLQRQTLERVYCSGECADADTRYFTGVWDPETLPAPEVNDDVA